LVRFTAVLIGEKIVRIKKRAFGTGAVAMAIVAAVLPATAEADSGGDASSGPWVGADHWTSPFPHRDNWVSPGRWGGYRGYTGQSTWIEPPVHDEQGWYPTPPPTEGPTPTASAEEPAPTVSAEDPAPTVTAEDPAPTEDPTASAEPVPSAPADPDPTTSAPTDPASTDPAPTPSPSGPGIVSKRSGLPWASGVYARGQGPGGVGAFAAWRGRANDVVVDWPARKTWDDIINPAWLYNIWKNTPETKVFGVAPVPEGDSSATMAGCAAGSYNDKWRQFGANIKAAGLDDEGIVRLGWEFNGNWYKWSARNPGEFAECWRQIVGTVEQVAPALRWDWNLNRGRGQGVADARLAYPGDDYVDIVGIDSYDMWPAARDEAGWQQQYAGEYGLKFWADFAAEHGKPLSVAEWGNYPGPASSGHGGGDNPFYVNKMMGFFRSQGSHLAYEAYFNESAGYFAGAIFAPAQVPAAAAQYRGGLTP
jgi:hypothetical protein